MRRLAAACAAIVVALPAQAATAEKPATAHRVQHLAAYQLHGPVHLQWTNTPGTDRVLARFTRGRTAPTTPHSGHPIAIARTAHAATLRGLQPGTVYSVALWTKHAGALSKPATVSFTTLQPAPAPMQTVTGVVVDSAGHPLRNAVVGGYPVDFFSEEPAMGSTRTDANGRFRLTVQQAGRYDLYTTGRRARGGNSDATGYADADHPVTVGEGGLHGLRFVLTAGGALRGTVTDAEGHPLAGVGVAPSYGSTPYLQPDAQNSYSVYYSAAPTTRTDAHGRYRLTGLADVATIVCLIPRRATGGNHDANGYAQRCAANSVAVAPRHTATAASVALQPRIDGAVTGTVTGPDGAPLRNVYVAINPHADSAYLGSVTTDASGHFTKTDVPLGRTGICPITDAMPGLGVIDRCRTVTVTRGAPTHVSVQLERGGAISGRLLARSGAPVARTYVDVVPADDHNGGGYGYTDGRGDFTVGGLITGRYRVCFGTGHSPAGPGPTGVAPGCLGRTITATIGRNTLGADHTLAPGGAIAGKVTDSAGHPFPTAALDFQRAGAGAGADGTGASAVDGTYLTKNLAPGRYRACATDYSYVFASRHICLDHLITVTRGHTVRGVELAFPPLTSIHATVTDPNGHPLSGVEVAALRACDPREGCPSQRVFGSRPVTTQTAGITGDTGSADLEDLRPGRYAVCALAYYAASPLGTPSTGYADKCTGSTFTVSVARGTNTSVTLQLAPGGTVTGRVTDPSGHGIRGATIDLAGSPQDDVTQDALGVFSGLDAEPSPFDDALTDVHGLYAIHSVRPGQAQLCAGQATGFRDHCPANKVTVTGGATTHAPTITLHRGPSARATARPNVPERRPVMVDGRIVAFHRA